MELTAIRHATDDGIATVFLDRPHRHNAWTGKMHAEFRWVMHRIEQNPAVRAVVITGTPPAFCVGGDSDALARHAEQGGYDTGRPAEPATPGIHRRPEYDDDSTLAAATDYARLLATTVGPNAVTVTKSQIYRDLHRHDAAASVSDSKTLLDDAMGTAEYREGIAALRGKRPPP